MTMHPSTPIEPSTTPPAGTRATVVRAIVDHLYMERGGDGEDWSQERYDALAYEANDRADIALRDVPIDTLMAAVPRAPRAGS